MRTATGCGKSVCVSSWPEQEDLNRSRAGTRWQRSFLLFFCKNNAEELELYGLDGGLLPLWRTPLSVFLLQSTTPVSGIFPFQAVFCAETAGGAEWQPVREAVWVACSKRML